MKSLEQDLEQIAKTHLHVASLQPRNQDRLDFYDCGVTSIRDALLAAYELGRANGKD